MSIEAMKLALEVLDLELPIQYSALKNALRAAIEQAEKNELKPDWDVLAATQESLREHMAEIQRLRSLLEQAEKQEPRKALVIRGQKDKIVAIYKENDIEIVRAEMPKQEWQGLTDEEAYAIFEEARHGSDKPVGVLRGVRAIEAKLKDKNA